MNKILLVLSTVFNHVSKMQLWSLQSFRMPEFNLRPSDILLGNSLVMTVCLNLLHVDGLEMSEVMVLVPYHSWVIFHWKPVILMSAVTQIHLLQSWFSAALNRYFSVIPGEKLVSDMRNWQKAVRMRRNKLYHVFWCLSILWYLCHNSEIMHNR